jgi:hypothetical protein
MLAKASEHILAVADSVTTPLRALYRSPGGRVVLFVVACLLLALRRPDAFTRPQFYAEDGKYWYAGAHERGIESWFTINGGYIQIMPRIVACLALPLPLTDVPLLFNAVAIALRVLAAFFVLSSRMRAAIPGRAARLVLFAFVLATPGGDELHAILTNAHFALALLAAFVLLVASISCTLGWRVFDLAVVILSGLSGPFCLLLAPLAVWRAWQTRDVWLGWLASVTAACALFQLLANYFEPRETLPLGATVEELTLILARVGTTALFGERGFSMVANGEGPLRWDLAFAIPVAAVVLAVIGRGLWIGQAGLRFFVGFAALSLAAALASPLVDPEMDQWAWVPLARTPYCGERYWFIPILALAGCLVAVAGTDTNRIWRGVGLTLLALTGVGIVADWQLPGWPENGFGLAALDFENAPPGTSLRIPGYPSDGWSFWLTRR